MRNNFFKIIALVLIAGSAMAQSTGYLGKRLQIGYGFNTSPALAGSNAKNKTIIGTAEGNAEDGTFAFNVIHDGFLELALSSRWMLGLSARYYKTTFDNNKYVELPNNQLSSYSSAYSGPEGYYNIRGLTYTLYFKNYGRRYVAPWGRYFMFGPTLNTMKTTYDPTVMNIKAKVYSSYSYSEKDTILSNFGSTEQDFVSLNLMMGWGRSRVIANRITIDYGCTFQVFALLGTYFDVVDTELVDDFQTLTPGNYIKGTVRKRGRGMNRFNVFLKVGILLF